MPTEKKRINLTVSEHIYEKLQKFKEANGIESDAAACMQLVIKQLKAQEQSEMMLDFLRKLPKEEWDKIALLGVDEMKAIVDATQPKNQ